MEYVINALHCSTDRLQTTNIAYVELNLVSRFWHCSLEVVTHIVLLFFVTAENSDFTNVGFQKAVEDGVAEAASTPSYH